MNGIWCSTAHADEHFSFVDVFLFFSSVFGIFFLAFAKFLAIFPMEAMPKLAESTHMIKIIRMFH